jgi:hypothetical protein
MISTFPNIVAGIVARTRKMLTPHHHHPTQQSHRQLYSSTEQPVKPVKTFALQDELPRLPIPPLEQTLERFRHSIKPFLPANSEQWQQAMAVIDDFGRSQGPVLHKRLLDYAKGQPVYGHAN